MIVTYSVVGAQGAVAQISPSRMHHTEAEKDIDMSDDSKQRADLHRMMMQDHMCPFGLKTLDLLKREGYEVDDHPLKSREEVEEFKAKNDVETTPQVFIDGKRIGGYEEVLRFFGKDVADKDAVTYVPVIALFAMAAAMALATSWASYGSLMTVATAEWFIAMSMCLLALQKLKDVESFATMFLNYDLLAQRWVRYGYVYPFGEGLAGVLMVSGALMWLSIPVALFIGTVGAVSVFKAVYIDRRELKCACVGGDSNVPLGFVSLTENLMMIGMALWMLTKPAGVGIGF